MEIQSASLSGEFAEIARVIQAEGPPDLFEEDQRIVGLGDEVNAPPARMLISSSAEVSLLVTKMTGVRVCVRILRQMSYPFS